MRLKCDMLKAGYGLMVANDGSFLGNRIEKRQLAAGISPKNAVFTHIEVIGHPPWSIRVAPPKTKLVDLMKYYKGKYVKVIRYKHFQDSETLTLVAFWAGTHCNVRYDWQGLFHFIFTWVKQHASRWFCSESFCWSHQQVYPGCFGNVKPSKFMPGHGGDPLYVDTIWEGVIDDKENKETPKANTEEN